MIPYPGLVFIRNNALIPTSNDRTFTFCLVFTASGDARTAVTGYVAFAPADARIGAARFVAIATADT
jgi:hypothetical protein